MEVIPSDDSGELDVLALEEMLSRGGVKAVAITHVPTNGGVVNPAREGADETVSRGLDPETFRGTIRLVDAGLCYVADVAPSAPTPPCIPPGLPA